MSFNRFYTLLLLSVSLIQAQNSTSGYRISVIDGEGALNSVASKTAREPVVQVSDANHRPVVGAYVEFDAPGSGAGATFGAAGTHFSTTTNSDGLAVGSNIKQNGISGPYAIQVHVSFQGQSIGEAQIHQTNISGDVSKHLPQNSASSRATGEVPGNVTLSNNVVGMALGDQFLVNGASTPSNANLLKGTRIQTLDKATTLYLHDNCEYLVGPHSAVTVNTKMVTLENGSVRAKRFGDCRVMYGGLWVTGAPTADGVAALTGQNLDVASIAGSVQVVNSAGDVITTVAPGTVSSFGASSEPSGATISGGGRTAIPFKTALLLGSSAGVVLAGLGISLDIIAREDSANFIGVTGGSPSGASKHTTGNGLVAHLSGTTGADSPRRLVDLPFTIQPASAATPTSP